ncbi:21869_t:CDS:2, partial [Gigaspora rosea]
LIDEVKRLRSDIGNETIFNPEGLIYERIEIDYLRVELSALNSNLALKNSELERMKNMLTLKNGELELIKNDLAKKNSEIRSLETRLKELLPCNRLSSEQVKIGENSQVDRDIQESLTQQTLTSLNEKQINNEQ